mgnify:CR=1 FL=1|tara:strand:- start:17588 stop:18079 length:492 start_codon:yes stop_codon:yes gene_type:complete
MVTTLTDIAVSAEQRLNDSKIGYDSKTAKIYAVNASDDVALSELELELVDSHKDVYDLLDNSDLSYVLKANSHIMVMTCGWAAPLSKSTEELDALPPSEHPQKRRVRLAILANQEGIMSVIRFQDSDETVLDEGKATGSLADAIAKALRKGSKANHPSTKGEA